MLLRWKTVVVVVKVLNDVFINLRYSVQNVSKNLLEWKSSSFDNPVSDGWTAARQRQPFSGCRTRNDLSRSHAATQYSALNSLDFSDTKWKTGKIQDFYYFNGFFSSGRTVSLAGTDSVAQILYRLVRLWFTGKWIMQSLLNSWNATCNIKLNELEVQLLYLKGRGSSVQQEDCIKYVNSP